MIETISGLKIKVIEAKMEYFLNNFSSSLFLFNFLNNAVKYIPEINVNITELNAEYSYPRIFVNGNFCNIKSKEIKIAK